MFIEGSIVSDKTELLVREYAELINRGVDASQILVLVQNSTLKSHFQEKVFKNLEVDNIGKMQIHSFFSLVYN